MTVPTISSMSIATSSAPGSRRCSAARATWVSAGRFSFSAAFCQKARTSPSSSASAGLIITGPSLVNFMAQTSLTLCCKVLCMEPTDDDEPLGNPADSLALIARERANLVRDIAPDPRLMYWPWGFAWLLGFGLMFLRFGPDGRVYVDMPQWLPLTVLALSFIAA